ncbi:MAG TPA: glycosyltransferase family 4 protein [Solirubrobacterales bacterium]
MRLGIGVFADEPSGLAVATVDTALALDGVGVDVTLFAVAGSTLPERAEAISDRVVRLRPIPRLLRGRVGSTALFLVARLATSRRLSEALKEHPVDALHVLSPGMAALVPRGPRVSVQAWFHPPRLLARLRTLLPFTARWFLYPVSLIVHVQSYLSDLAGYRRADLVLANTEVAATALRSRGFEAVCVPPPIEVGAEPLAPRGGQPSRLVFCSHPLTLKRKGLRFLFEALPTVRHRPLELTLVGAMDPSLERGVERIRGAGIEVRVLGKVPREDYLELLARETDLLLFPSLYEEWGYALFEALGRGVPALAFDLYPFSEIIDERTGMLVEPRDAAALADAVERAGSGALPDPEGVRDSARARFGGAHVAERILELMG